MKKIITLGFMVLTFAGPLRAEIRLEKLNSWNKNLQTQMEGVEEEGPWAEPSVSFWSGAAVGAGAGGAGYFAVSSAGMLIQKYRVRNGIGLKDIASLSGTAGAYGAVLGAAAVAPSALIYGALRNKNENASFKNRALAVLSGSVFGVCSEYLFLSLALKSRPSGYSLAWGAGTGAAAAFIATYAVDYLAQ